MTKKTGLLLPRSILYPAINFDLLEGVRAGLEANGQQDTTILTDNIGIGADDQYIYNCCERMLMDGCSVIAGYVNPGTALKLQPLFESANAVFICIDSGYQFMLPDPRVLPNVVYVSLQGTLCCRATAAMAAGAGFSSFAFSTSFLDAGYRTNYTYARAVAAEGGSTVFNHVSALKRSDFTLEPLASFVSREPQHALAAAYCGDMLQDFCAHAAKTAGFSKHIFVSPFMLEETWLERSDYPGSDMHGTVTWARDLAHAANDAFRQRMAEKGRGQNFFSVLGYEAGYIAAQIAGNGKAGQKAVDALKGWRYESPRGEVYIDETTNQSIPPIYYAKGVRDEETGKCRLETTGRCVDNAAEQWQLLQQDIAELKGSTTNWHNTYPCIES